MSEPACRLVTDGVPARGQWRFEIRRSWDKFDLLRPQLVGLIGNVWTLEDKQMKRPGRACLLLVGTLLAWGIPWAGPATAQPAWETNRGECDTILSTPQHYDLDEVRTCIQRWESYGEAEAISRAEAEAYARGMSRLFYQGNRRDQSLAESALQRLGLSVLPRGDFVPDERLEAFLNRDRSPIRGESVSARATRRAREHNTRGMRDYNRGRYDDAAGEFESALQDDPFYVLSKYNLACQLALLGDAEGALLHLDELSRWDVPEAQEQLTHARSDEDFVSLREDVRFRLITGYARIQVLNGSGDAGVSRTTEIRDALAAQGLDVVSFGHDRHLRSRPAVWYQRGYDQVADRVEAVLASESTRTQLMDWSSDYDVIVLWGDSGDDDAPLARPLVQGLLRIEGGDPEEAMEDTEETAEDALEIIEDPEGAAEEWQPDF